MLRKIVAAVKSDASPKVDLNAVLEKLKAQRKPAPDVDNKFALPSKVHPPIQGVGHFGGVGQFWNQAPGCVCVCVLLVIVANVVGG